MAIDPKKHGISKILQATCLLPLFLFFYATFNVPSMVSGDFFRIVWAWVPTLGIQLSFMIDGLSILFTLIITGVGFFVTLYAADYLHGNAQAGRFFFFLHAFMISMVGLVLADNAITLFVFWEMTTLFSYLLIGFDHEKEASRKSARQALLVTGSGGLALLVGFLLLEMVTGTYEISKMVSMTAAIQSHPFYIAILVLVFIGAFTKSAQFPFHFWLPGAMAAPAPVSAFLHSATMVKGGIYLLARFYPILGGSTAWALPLVLVGAVTALLGALTALGRKDLKEILAYTTITSLGIMTMLLGGESLPSLVAVMTFLLVHAIYKSALFLVAGIIDHQTGTRRIDALGGLARFMPFTAFAVFAAAFSMAGFPLFFGFIGKEIMYKGTLAETLMPGIATATAVLANGLMTAVAGILVIRPFLTGSLSSPGPVREASFRMWIGPLLLGWLGIFFGIVPDRVGDWLISPAVNAFYADKQDVQLALYHGINEPLLLSVLTLTIGALLYWKRKWVYHWTLSLSAVTPIRAAKVYDAMLHGVSAVARFQTRFLQNGSLHRYFFIVTAVFVIFTGYSYMGSGGTFPEIQTVMLDLKQWLLLFLIFASVVSVVVTRSVLLAICALGVTGAGIAMIFLSFGAPDLALTQLLVETLTVI
ncbi:MAG: proton-conducting transporter membrane subunit, partial [Desulfobacterales bacterium]